MFQYVLKRVLALIPILFVVSIIIFSVLHLAPGNPASIMLGPQASPEQVESLYKSLGLDKPFIVQYFDWLKGVLKGDLGDSYFMDISVSQAIISHVGPTLSLTIISITVTVLVAIPLGIHSANNRGTFIDQSLMGFSLFGLSVPSFLLGLLSMMFIGVYLGWLPVAGYEPLSSGFFSHLKYLILPAFSLGMIQVALVTRMTRSSMLEVLSSDFIKTAEAKGVKTGKVLYIHALRSACLPVLTVIGQSFGTIIAGAVITETIFNIPGIGQLIINSVERRDLTLIQGVVLFVTVAYVFINLVVDILYGLIDPRVSIDKSK